MKRFVILLVLLVSVTSARAVLYESRTPRHAVAVEIVSITGNDVVFGVTVSDLPGGEVLTSSRQAGTIGAPAEIQADAGGQHLQIRVALQGTMLSCRLDIVKGSEIIDTIESIWATQPLRSPFEQSEQPVRVKPPAVLTHTNPQYPDLARKEKVSGLVVLEVVIDHTGVLKDIKVIQPLPDGLSEAAVEAVKHWTFAPGTLNGKPVDVIFNLTVNFKL